MTATSTATATIAERVVRTTLDTYARLPKHGKPAVRNNGVPEWTILASISLTTGEVGADGTGATTILPIALGTGVKVLPATRLPPLGDTLHDSHAEVLARRGFVRWLLAEAEHVVSGAGAGLLLWDAAARQFALAPGVQVWLYVSALPCGDASTLHTSAHQDTATAEAFAAAPELAAQLKEKEKDGAAVRGRNGYETFGAIRTKPGRADSPPSISFSCSDKITAWNTLGLQGGLLQCFAPVYLDHIVVGEVGIPEGEADAEAWEGKVVAEAQRALYGRVAGVEAALPEPYRLATPEVQLTHTPFPLSRSGVAAIVAAAVATGTAGTETQDAVTSNVSLSHVPALGKPEVITNGCAGGAWKGPGRVLLKDKQRSRLCKLEALKAYAKLRASLGEPIAEDATYFALKRENAAYQAAKSVLRGTPRRALPDAWARVLPAEGGFSVTAAEGADAPFVGWITGGEAYEGFTTSGSVSVSK